MNAIKNEDLDNQLIITAENRDKTERIINENLISEEEVRFMNIIFNRTAIIAWIPNFIKDNFNSDIHDKFFSENVAFAQTLGFDYRESYDDLRENCTNMKYIGRIDSFDELLEAGLALFFKGGKILAGRY